MDKLTSDMVEYVRAYFIEKHGTEYITPEFSALFGDGSDRKLYRVRCNCESVIFVTNEAAVNPNGVCENDSFDYIDKHLKRAGVSTPDIYSYSKERGWFILEDLGDETLFVRVRGLSDEREVEKLYRRAIDALLTMQVEGIKGFDTKMCYSTKYYDKDLILNHESGYFFREFINGYLKIGAGLDELHDEFGQLADEALKNTGRFFLHRDYQARNIMFKDGKLRIIDFQGGRVGPLQYDLAALVIDAFVNLPFDMKDRLFEYYIGNLKNIMEVGVDDFKKRLYLTAVHRTMQALGAYAFLTMKKGKAHFEEHMGKGVNNLKVFLDRASARETAPKLCALVDSVYKRFHG